MIPRWIFYGKDVSLKTDHELFSSMSLKIVACDVNMKTNITENQRCQEMYNNQEDNN